MEDGQILELYWQRREQAIAETDRKYGGYCYSIAYQILTNPEDAEESVSDTYLAAWNAIPPKRPALLAAFLGKITRHLSIDRWRERNTYKRGGGDPGGEPAAGGLHCSLCSGLVRGFLRPGKRQPPVRRAAGLFGG